MDVPQRWFAKGRTGQVEVYTDQPELAEKPGVPKGKLTQQQPWQSKIFPHTTREWWIYVPAQYKDDQPACVMISSERRGLHRVRSHGIRQSDRQGGNAGDGCRIHQPWQRTR